MDDKPIDITGANVREEKRYTVGELVNSPTFHAYVKQVLVPKYAWEFRKNREDLEQDFWVKVLKPSQLLKIIDHPKTWAGTIMRNLCLNQNRDDKLERNSTEALHWEDGRIKEAAIQDESGACDDPTDDVEEPELTEEQKCEIRRRVLSILETLPPNERAVTRLRLMTIPVEVIAMQIRKSPKTVYRLAKRRKPVLKQIVKELGLDPRLLKNSLSWAAFSKLIAISLREDRKAQ